MSARKRRPAGSKGQRTGETTMEAHDTRQLVRLVSGRLDGDAARRLRLRAAEDPALALELARLERAWAALDDAPAPAVPPGFAGRVMARVREEARNDQRSPRLSWLAAPTWARAAGAVALVAGLAAGAGLGAGLGVGPGGGATAASSTPAADLEAVYDSAAATTTLAQDYADVLAAFDGGEGEGS